MTTSHTDRAKRPRSVAAGPYGHPFHPILVTIPIGTWIASLVFDIASRTSQDGAAFAHGATWLIGIGILGALLAAMVGLHDLSLIPKATKAFSTGLTHMVLNLVVVALFSTSFLMRQGSEADAVETLPLVLTVVALALLGASGWLGGKLAYHYGVRVADEQTQAEGFVRRSSSR
jgi:uncharacterized membrane protein